ncbi:MAG: hypothetical protein WC632_07905 [Candidatus Margulisiibacteriota bacterium]
MTDSGNQKTVIFPLAFVLTGAAALTAQFLLVRELINFSAGNDLIYGLVIFSWLLLYAGGSWLLGKFAHKIKDRIFAFSAGLALVALLLPGEIFLARVIKVMGGVAGGALAGLPATLWATGALLAPLTLTLGFLFALGSLLLAENQADPPRQVGLVYIYEALGALGGGAALSFFLIIFLDPFQIAGLLNLLAAVTLFFLGKKSARGKITFIGGGLAVLGLALLLGGPWLNSVSTQLSLGPQRLVEVADSPYGRIIVTRSGPATIFYQNGNLLLAGADRQNDEEVAHLSLLPRAELGRILLIGGARPGLINELKKYPLQRLDCLELDQKLIALIGQYFGLDASANILAVDGVNYLRQTKEKYDLILINLPGPSSTVFNRCYTLEFFQLCRGRLRPGGILTFHLPTADAYLGRELVLLNRSLRQTVGRVFPHVLVIPGNYNYFYASDAPLPSERAALFRLWSRKNIKTRYFNSAALAGLLWPDKVKYLRAVIEDDQPTPLNTAARPVSYFYELLLWSRFFSPALTGPLLAIFRLDLIQLLIGLLIFGCGLNVLARLVKPTRAPALVFVLGAAGLAAQLSVIYACQSDYGDLYQLIGLLSAAFMAGLATGGYAAIARISARAEQTPVIRLAVWSLLLVLLGLHFTLKVCPLPLASFLIALPIGAVFPLAVSTQARYAKESGGLGGLLYGADLLGGAVAALLTTLVVIPVFGPAAALLTALGLALAALALAY